MLGQESYSVFPLKKKKIQMGVEKDFFFSSAFCTARLSLICAHTGQYKE